MFVRYWWPSSVSAKLVAGGAGGADWAVDCIIWFKGIVVNVCSALLPGEKITAPGCCPLQQTARQENAEAVMATTPCINPITI